MARKAIVAQDAVSVGPYSQAIEADGLVFLSGQTPIDPRTGQLISDDIKEQTTQSFRNLFKVLAAAGMTGESVIKVNVFLTDMKNFKDMNEVYARQFSEPYPARTTIGVRELPLGAQIEIEMVARR
jgi:2-iminobutanoate/2-iminopropanoate deaminase